MKRSTNPVVTCFIFSKGELISNTRDLLVFLYIDSLYYNVQFTIHNDFFFCPVSLFLVLTPHPNTAIYPVEPIRSNSSTIDLFLEFLSCFSRYCL